MEQEESPRCTTCGEAMTVTTRISLPAQKVYRCEPCKTEAWVLDRKDVPLDRK